MITRSGNIEDQKLKLASAYLVYAGKYIIVSVRQEIDECYIVTEFYH